MKKHRYTVVIDGKEAYWGDHIPYLKKQADFDFQYFGAFLQRLCVTTRSIAREPMIPNGIDLRHLAK